MEQQKEETPEEVAFKKYLNLTRYGNSAQLEQQAFYAGYNAGRHELLEEAEKAFISGVHRKVTLEYVHMAMPELEQYIKELKERLNIKP